MKAETTMNPRTAATYAAFESARPPCKICGGPAALVGTWIDNDGLGLLYSLCDGCFKDPDASEKVEAIFRAALGEHPHFRTCLRQGLFEMIEIRAFDIRSKKVGQLIRDAQQMKDRTCCLCHGPATEQVLREGESTRGPRKPALFLFNLCKCCCADPQSRRRLDALIEAKRSKQRRAENARGDDLAAMILNHALEGRA